MAVCGTGARRFRLEIGLPLFERSNTICPADRINLSFKDGLLFRGHGGDVVP
jgi:hypothetical protein